MHFTLTRLQMVSTLSCKWTSDMLGLRIPDWRRRLMHLRIKANYCLKMCLKLYRLLLNNYCMSQKVTWIWLSLFQLLKRWHNKSVHLYHLLLHVLPMPLGDIQVMKSLNLYQSGRSLIQWQPRYQSCCVKLNPFWSNETNLLYPNSGDSTQYQHACSSYNRIHLSMYYL